MARSHHRWLQLAAPGYLALAACSGSAVDLGDGPLEGPAGPAVATCSDGVQNGAETGVDCGGGGCAACFLEQCLCESDDQILALGCPGPEAEIEGSPLISDDGSTIAFSVCKRSRPINDPEIEHAPEIEQDYGCKIFRWTAEGLQTSPELQWSSVVWSISADGQRVLVGSANNYFDSPELRQALSVEADGSVLSTGLSGYPPALAVAEGFVGFTLKSIGVVGLARWSREHGFEELATLPYLSRSLIDYNLYAATPDGRLVVGSTIDRAGNRVPIRWSEANGLVLGMEGLPPPANGASLMAVSDDGSTLAGVTYLGRQNISTFRWTASGGFVELWPGGYEGSVAMSADGTVVAGERSFQEQDETFRWSDQSGLGTLQQLQGPFWMSADGAVIAGNSSGYPSSQYEWPRVDCRDGCEGVLSPYTPPRRVQFGVNGGSTTGLSSDGRILVGRGQCGGVDAAFRRVLGQPPFSF